MNLGATYSSNPYVVFNTVSPNDSGALKQAQVRQALSYALDRSQILKTLGGPVDQPAADPRLADGHRRLSGTPADYNPYPYNQSKAKTMLSAAGFTSTSPLLAQAALPQRQPGRPRSPRSTSQSQLNALGSVKVTLVPTNQSDFYGKYLYVTTLPVAGPAGHLGHGDRGLGPDWYGNSAVSFFNPLFSAPAASRPTAAATSGTSPTRPSTA